MIITISNNPANPKAGNEWDTREFDIDGCEFFENWGYRQIVIGWIVTTKDWDWKKTGQYVCVWNSNDWDFDYNALRSQAMETCEFQDVANITKAEACPNITQSIVEQFDAQGLFN